MARARRIAALATMLIRLHWRPELGRGHVRYRDHQGRQAILVVVATSEGIVLIPSRPGPLRLTRLDAGRLRGAVKAAVDLQDLPADGVVERLVADRVWLPAA
jgi:hypothetical protein